jgi:anti-anti-sigma regulatory factor
MAVYSSGLGLMIRIRRFVTDRGGTLSLVNVSESIYDMFIALNINKVFNIYATDVEFEISQDNFVDNNASIGFLFVPKKEADCYHINISGEMTDKFDLSPCQEMLPATDVTRYIFDLSSLEIVDSVGADALLKLTERIKNSGGDCRAFGASEMKREMLTILGADRFLTFYKDERSAYNGNNSLE